MIILRRTLLALISSLLLVTPVQFNAQTEKFPLKLDEKYMTPLEDVAEINEVNKQTPWFDFNNLEMKNFTSENAVISDYELKDDGIVFPKDMYEAKEGRSFDIVYSTPTWKSVSVSKIYSYLSEAPQTIYYNRDGYIGYIPLASYSRDENYPFYIVVYSGPVVKKGPGAL